MTINDLRKHDKLMKFLAIYIIIEYGISNLKIKDFVDNIKQELVDDNKNCKLMTNEYLKDSVDLAVKISSLEQNDICKLIYQEEKNKNKQERGR